MALPAFLVPALISAASVIGSAVSGYFQGEAEKEAAKTQSKAAQSGIDEQRRQFDAIQSLLNPYVEAGNNALQQQQALAGTLGQAAQQEALSGIQSGSEFKSLTQQGENSILQNASATGGLRGGNVQSSLAQFRPALLNNLINQKYQQLGGLSQMGQASAAGVGSAGQASANNITNLLGQQGQAIAQGQIGQGNALANIPGAITGGLGLFTGLGGFGGSGPINPEGLISGNGNTGSYL
ncbi:MAG: hypothetical protein WBA74_10455 [Cyclobacteriaceae bacterium]